VVKGDPAFQSIEFIPSIRSSASTVHRCFDGANNLRVECSSTSVSRRIMASAGEKNGEENIRVPRVEVDELLTRPMLSAEC
jgi:hypothetical protein